MIENIKSWLAAYYKVDGSAIEAYFRNEDVTGFLIIWTIFEQKLFAGSANGKKIQTFKNLKFEKLICNLQEEFNHFFSAYQDKYRFKNLIHEEKSLEKINNILRAERDSLSEEDKLFCYYL